MTVWEMVERAGLNADALTESQWERMAERRNKLGTRAQSWRRLGHAGPPVLFDGHYSQFASGTVQYGIMLNEPLTRRKSALWGLTSIDDE